MDETLFKNWVISGKAFDGSGRALCYEASSAQEAEGLFLLANPGFWVVRVEESIVAGRK